MGKTIFSLHQPIWFFVALVTAQPLAAQTRYTLFFRASTVAVPAQSCSVLPLSRDAKAGDAKAGDAKAGDAKAGDAKAGDAKAGDAKAGDAKAEKKDEHSIAFDSLLIAPLTMDGAASIALPASVEFLLDGKLVGGLSQNQSNTAVIVRTSGTFVGMTLEITLANRGPSVCVATVDGPAKSTAASDKASDQKSDDSKSDPSLTLSFGPEFNSASGFKTTDQLNAALGARWDLLSTGDSHGNRYSLVATLDYSSAIVAHEYRTCFLSPSARPLRLPENVPASQDCAPGKVTFKTNADASIDTLIQDRLYRADSIRSSTIGAYRAVLRARVERPYSGINWGLVGGLGVEPDPRGLTIARFSNSFNPLRPLWSFGVGLRQLGSDGTERFVLDLSYGSVRNYFNMDVVVASSNPDTIPTLTATSIQVADRRQLQVALNARLFKGASVRAFATLNGSAAPAPTLNSPFWDPGFPDVVRIAFLLNRDAKNVWDALTGSKGAKDPGSTNDNAETTADSKSSDSSKSAQTKKNGGSKSDH